ncbi:MAG TPA: hypothetical protein VFV99_25330 [Kofleriaceae bacterium]|nr:hypothetical protein [Kofleriaceae bacterium]
MRVVLSFVLILAACGDNGGGGDDMMPGPCTPPVAPLPTTGMYIDPNAAELPSNCVADGLRDLPGRWFVSDQAQYFRFEYPKYEGSCTTGFSRLGNTDDHDASDGYSFFTWSDGTRYWQREAYEYGNTVFIRVYAACLTSSDTLAATYITYDTDRGERISRTTGERFAAHKEDSLATGLTLVGSLEKGLPGEVIEGLNLMIDGTHAYLAGIGGLEIIDISDPTAPVAVGHYDGSWNDVRVVNDGTNVVAFLSPFGSEDPTQVVNVTDPAAPTFVSMLQEYSHSLQIQERNGKKELYLATYNESVPKYDVTAPLTPVRQGMAIVPGDVSGVHDLYVDGDKIYACNTTLGLVGFDTSGGFGTSNVELGRYRLGYSHAAWAGTIGGRKIVLAGDEGMTASPSGGAHLSILDGDTASPTFMHELAIYQTRREVGIHYFEVHGNKVYIAYYHDGVRVIDLTDPTHPVEVAHYNDWIEDNAYGGAFEGALAVRKIGDLLYVADLERGLLVLREQ